MTLQMLCEVQFAADAAGHWLVLDMVKARVSLELDGVECDTDNIAATVSGFLRFVKAVLGAHICFDPRLQKREA